ncbi:MAG TPA: MBL fold metallo-hydrolase [Chthoniobacterales bacterium]
MTPTQQDAAGCYENPDRRRPRGFADLLRWKLRLGPSENSETFPGSDGRPPYRPEVFAPDLGRIHTPDPARIQATWVGHATFLIQVGGLNFLTDPHWSRRASPVPWAGPHRSVPPALAFEDLPRIDAALVSHNHYDHLDRATVRRLSARQSSHPEFQFFVPLGLGRWFARLGAPASEAGWGGQHRLRGKVTLTCVPAQHWSSRTPVDRRRSLWCGWVIETAGHRVYFAGDTGWTDGLFEDLGREQGPFDLAFLPIGAYAPRWFMADQHADPREAVRIHRAVRSRRSLGMHWGTFRLTDEPLAQPPLLLALALAEAGVSPAEFHPARLGETLEV